MNPNGSTGYGACYLDDTLRVATVSDWPMADLLIPATTNRSGLAWLRTLFALLVVGVLTTLGIANIALYSRWQEVEDGVLWVTRAQGVIASEVAPNSPAARAGLRSGDVLLGINGVAVQTPADVVAIADDYAAWMSENDIPKLFVNAEPGAILIGAVREFCRSWKNQTEVTVPGSHFIQEDSGPAIGKAIAGWMRVHSL